MDDLAPAVDSSASYVGQTQNSQHTASAAFSLENNQANRNLLHVDWPPICCMLTDLLAHLTSPDSHPKEPSASGLIRFLVGDSQHSKPRILILDRCLSQSLASFRSPPCANQLPPHDWSATAFPVEGKKDSTSSRLCLALRSSCSDTQSRHWPSRRTHLEAHLIRALFWIAI